MATPVSPSMASDYVDLDAGAFQQSSPLSLRQMSDSTLSQPSTSTHRAPSHDYNFSGAASDENASTLQSDEIEQLHDRDTDLLRRRDQRIFSGCSSISSISSFPTSISQRPPQQHQHDNLSPPSQRNSIGPSPLEKLRGFDRPTTPQGNLAAYPSPFRHPSSIRAMQMKDEIFSDTNSVLRHHRRSGSQMSSYSQRSGYSNHTSPTKRSNRSHRSSPSKGCSNLKKEFPLVLLHCTLLSPNIRVKPGSVEDSLLLELLPEEYKERWIALRTKLVDIEISSRGVLIPHPREDMALLEERLLESLELEKPRIRHNHYFQSGGSATDSGFESAGTEDEADPEDDSCSVKCPDCGRSLHPEEINRKWEVKVFAANGLMRAGAWAAAWQEMEKIDVEINVWLPEELRQELQDKLALLEAPPLDGAQLDSGDGWAQSEPSILHEREQYGEPGITQSHQTLGDVNNQTSFRSELADSFPPPVKLPQHVRRPLPGNMQDLTRNKNNVLIGLFGLLALFFALTGMRQPSSAGPSPSLRIETTQVAEIVTTTVTTTSLAISTAIVTVSSVPETSSILEVVSTETPAPMTVEEAVESLTTAESLTLKEQDSIMEHRSILLSETPQPISAAGKECN